MGKLNINKVLLYTGPASSCRDHEPSYRCGKIHDMTDFGLPSLISKANVVYLTMEHLKLLELRLSTSCLYPS